MCNVIAHLPQGIDGPVEFSGNTPDLDDFSIRIVDGMYLTTSSHWDLH